LQTKIIKKRKRKALKSLKNVQVEESLPLKIPSRNLN
jgi:hypothetical protein